MLGEPEELTAEKGIRYPYSGAGAEVTEMLNKDREERPVTKRACYTLGRERNPVYGEKQTKHKKEAGYKQSTEEHY